MSIRPCSVLVSMVVALGCAGACAPGGEPANEVEVALGALVDSVAAQPAVPGAILYAYAPSQGLEWAGASGVDEADSGGALTADQPFRNASNTKTYTAAAVLRLWEAGLLDLDAPIRGFLDDEQAELLVGDGYDVDAITIRELLSHTAGLIDHGSTASYLEAVLADPARRWTRDDQLAGAVDWGDPLGASGRAYSYSDTGYILLGQVIERVTDQPLGPAVRELLHFDRLGLTATWWELFESPQAGTPTRARQYIGGTDTFDWDPSLDSYGGGGLVTNAHDLAGFWYALFTGEVFDEEATLETMKTTPIPESETPYRLGLFVREIAGMTAYEHSGFWGSRAIYVPELDLVVAGLVTEQSRGADVFAMTERAVELIAGG